VDSRVSFCSEASSSSPLISSDMIWAA
jgi:hypothetical protein